MRAGLRWRSPRHVLSVLAVSSALAWIGLETRTEGAEPVAESSASGARAGFIDEMYKKAMDEADIKPSPLCTDEEYLRRAYLDVLGRIPNIEEALAFLQSKEKGKRAKLVEYLLKHPDFAKNFGNQWTILLMGGRGSSRGQDREVDRDALATWLRQQVNADRPWNEIAYDLIAAKGSNKENGAVNFTIAHLDNGAVPLTSITSRVFLGLQIQCTQCHDHPSNDWKQADFWGINAFFKGVKKRRVMKEDATGKEVIDHVELDDEPTDAFASYDRRNAMVGIAFPKYLDGRKISQGTDVDRRVELAKMIADPKNPELAKAFVNRMWGHFLGRGFVQPVDDFGPHNPPSHPELLDRLAREFQASHYDIKALIRWIMNSQPYHVSSVITKANEKDETLFSHMALKPLSPEQLFDSLLTATAAHQAGGADNSEKQRDAWLKQFIFTFANDEGEEGSTFQGTIPQALMMMNGELIAKAVGGKPGSFLADLLERANASRSPVDYMVNNLYLAALSRAPSRGEKAMAQKFLGSNPDTIEVLEDIFWALLNSNEFVLNR
jgi:hypothetical protein